MIYNNRLIAMYLPQFHHVKENDEWWGEGFTEWTTVKAAKPLFRDHEQPRKPLEDRYYNLLNKNTMEWQADLMHKYGIDGMCIYHYWFEAGRQILEKPAENLLVWKDIDMPFCFCWANESWARSWSNLKQKNVWASTFENGDEEDSGLLLEQDYGAEEDWIAHFRYLLPFFRDKRYICHDGKPVFVIYRSSDVSCIREMLQVWRKLAYEAGLPGLYIIGSNCERSMKSVLDGQLFHEPQHSVRELRSISLADGNVCCLKYRNVWEAVLRTESTYDMQPFFEGFVGYDDTPRRGIEGVVVTGGNPAEFEEMLVRLIQKNMRAGADFIFLNAWNEWGEGMYLEPDSRHGYQYLEALKKAKERAGGEFCRDEQQDNISMSMYRGMQILQQRTDTNLHILEKWFHLVKRGFSLGRYIKTMFPGEIAIYGYGFLGKLLYEDMEEANVSVKYIVERNTAAVHVNVPVFKIEDNLPVVDCIIVTAQYYYDEIYTLIHDKGNYHIVSIDKILDDCLGKPV